MTERLRSQPGDKKARRQQEDQPITGSYYPCQAGETKQYFWNGIVGAKGHWCIRWTSDQNHLHWLGIIVSSCMSYLITHIRNAELTSYHQTEEFRKIKRRSQSMHPTNLPESFLLESILAERCRCHQEGPWVRVTGQIHLVNYLTYHKTWEMAEQFWVLLPCRSPPGRPLPIKSLALAARVSPRTIHFWVLDKSPLLGPGWGPPFLQQVDAGTTADLSVGN